MTITADLRNSAPGQESPVSVVEKALWQRFATAEDDATYLRDWLALQCARIDGAKGAAVVLGEPDTGPFRPAAVWPAGSTPQAELNAAAEAALRQRQPAVSGVPAGEATRAVAVPILMDGRLHGVAAVLIGVPGEAAASALRRLQWGTGWVEALLRRRDLAEAQHLGDRAALGFDLLATIVEQEGFDAAAAALVTELARRFDCDPVSLGLRRRQRCRVVALSHASDFGRKLGMSRAIAEVMDEACDQEAAILHPLPEEWEFRVTRAHVEHAAAQDAGAILTVPLQTGDRIVGALVFERPRGAGFTAETVELIDAAASLLGPVLLEKHANDRLLITKAAESLGRQLLRLLGPRHFGRKLATLIAAGVFAFFATATVDHAVTSPVVIEAEQRRTLAAPFAGYLAAQYARAGEQVAAGDLLAALDDQDLQLERLRWATARSQRQTEYDRALSARDRAEAAIIQAQIEQADAQLRLIDEQLARTRILAPFDGILVEGDLSQRVGGAVERGETLMVIAPPDAWRAVLEVDERDIARIAPGQSGSMVLSAMPEASLRYTVERLTPVSRQSEGRNFFRVEARIEGDLTRLRPAMAGIAKTDMGEALLIVAWTQRAMDWARLSAWRWMP